MDFKNVDDILDFAIQNEQQAADFYYNLANESEAKEMRETFVEYAKEEEGHKARLVKIKETGEYDLSEEKVLNLKIGDYLVISKPSSGKMSYQEALILAMKREKAAYKLYMKLCEIAPNDELKKMFNGLAIEEAKHKLKFEIEYDDVIYKGN